VHQKNTVTGAVTMIRGGKESAMRRKPPEPTPAEIEMRHLLQHTLKTVLVLKQAATDALNALTRQEEQIVLLRHSP